MDNRKKSPFQLEIEGWVKTAQENLAKRNKMLNAINAIKPGSKFDLETELSKLNGILEKEIKALDAQYNKIVATLSATADTDFNQVYSDYKDLGRKVAVQLKALKEGPTKEKPIAPETSRNIVEPQPYRAMPHNLETTSDVPTSKKPDLSNYKQIARPPQQKDMATPPKPDLSNYKQIARPPQKEEGPSHYKEIPISPQKDMATQPKPDRTGYSTIAKQPKKEEDGYGGLPVRPPEEGQEISKETMEAYNGLPIKPQEEGPEYGGLPINPVVREQQTSKSLSDSNDDAYKGLPILGADKKATTLKPIAPEVDKNAVSTKQTQTTVNKRQQVHIGMRGIIQPPQSTTPGTTKQTLDPSKTNAPKGPRNSNG